MISHGIIPELFFMSNSPSLLLPDDIFVSQFPEPSAATSTRSRWVELAREIGDELKQSAGERERRGEIPTAEVQRLRDTGLVNLLIPKKLGGLGASFQEAAHVVMELSRGDASVGALLAFHLDVSAIPRLFDFSGDAESIDRLSAANRWFWGNALQGSQVKEFTARPLPNGRFVLNGRKEWSTGVSMADVLLVMALRTDRKEILFALIPKNRKGLVFHDDWDHLGLRRAEILTVDFHEVEIEPHEVIVSTHGTPIAGFPPFYNAISSLFLHGANHLGSVLGALEQGRAFIQTKTPVRRGSQVDSATKDPYVLAEFGNFWIQLQPALALLDRVAEDLQEGYNRRLHISPREISEIGLKASALRIFSAKIGLEITSRIFEVAGAHSTANCHGFDRYWRDIRILSVRQPPSYIVKGIGNYALNDEVPSLTSFL
jgi:alkylation response protein AidB-like acyl-CoA dehydrogenase